MLEKFDGDFATVAQAVTSGEFALWLGSGISGQAPSLGGLIERALEYLRVRAIDFDSADKFLPAFKEALTLSGVNLDEVEPHYTQPFNDWPQKEAIVEKLWNKYSRLLDIRIPGEDSDFMLWDAVDIRAAFDNPEPPSAEHLCIAILILEGSVQSIASANWDQFIEEAVSNFAGDTDGLLQVVVDPDQMRQVAGQAKLLKFHGCIGYATDEPGTFRQYLTGSHTQITEWPDKPQFNAMKTEVIQLATNQKTMVMGLSIQDANLQAVFSQAKQVHPWPWPCAPQAPGHVFCEDEIKDGQRDVLKIVYGDAYNNNIIGIEAQTHIRSWAVQVLIALVFLLLFEKLSKLIELKLQVIGKNGMQHELVVLLKQLRDVAASSADGDRTKFTLDAVSIWARALSIFRSGMKPENSERHELLSSSTPGTLPNDANAQTTKLGHLGVAFGLLQHGCNSSTWKLDLPQSDDLSSGTLSATANWEGAQSRPVFLVRGAGEAIKLQKNGALEDGNAIIIHADEVMHEIFQTRSNARSPGGRYGRTGHITPKHMSIEDLLNTSANVDELKSNFVAEMAL